eukprot:gnl/TRDRNA2_/TRDRNA2_136528_c0_seq1.p1 gnl/TRDRNA2_/TRDRNA2_136528_c0~~gnl/TRDRNA2_/TRDRNA2_136528_c0_seq1.p1  ORF type:complete len:539 (+),score=111.24 gnl/TRDRNA2_/TRDRNA2_136528_c0_seq1:92-1708(+)
MTEAMGAPTEELAFWRSESWIDIWSGAKLKSPASGSAEALVWSALLPSSSVNFPQITEICERVTEKPNEAESAVRLLVQALRDSFAPMRKKLKALTISNEMMYDQFAVAVFIATDGLREALAVLRDTRNTELGDYVDENIRMLAAEIEKNCFSEDVAQRAEAARRAEARNMRRIAANVKNNLGAAIGGFIQSQSKPDDSMQQMGQENNFYYDSEHKRWRQKGVPDEISWAQITGPGGGPAASASAAPAKAASSPPAAAEPSIGAPPPASGGPPSAFPPSSAGPPSALPPSSGGPPPSSGAFPPSSAVPSPPSAEVAAPAHPFAVPPAEPAATGAPPAVEASTPFETAQPPPRPAPPASVAASFGILGADTSAPPAGVMPPPPSTTAGGAPPTNPFGSPPASAGPTAAVAAAFGMSDPDSTGVPPPSAPANPFTSPAAPAAPPGVSPPPPGTDASAPAAPAPPSGMPPPSVAASFGFSSGTAPANPFGAAPLDSSPSPAVAAAFGMSGDSMSATSPFAVSFGADDAPLGDGKGVDSLFS